MDGIMLYIRFYADVLQLINVCEIIFGYKRGCFSFVCFVEKGMMNLLER